MNVSIVIPAHNEEADIAATIEGVLKNVTIEYELIVVLDHCTDKTEEIVRGFMAKNPQIRIVENKDRRGSFSNSVITGFNAANGTAIVTLMADNCDDATTINRMWEKIENNVADVVCASRYMKGGAKIGGPRLQDILSRLTCYSLKILTGMPTWDIANAYKMYRTTVLKSLKYDIPNNGTEYSMGILYKAYFKGARITEVPTTWRGQSIPVADEWKILKRFPGYWYWYKRAIEKKEQE